MPEVPCETSAQGSPPRMREILKKVALRHSTTLKRKKKGKQALHGLQGKSSKCFALILQQLFVLCKMNFMYKPKVQITAKRIKNLFSPNNKNHAHVCGKHV